MGHSLCVITVYCDCVLLTKELGQVSSTPDTNLPSVFAFLNISALFISGCLVSDPTRSAVTAVCPERGWVPFLHQEFVGLVENSGKCVHLEDGQRGLKVQEDTKYQGPKKKK